MTDKGKNKGEISELYTFIKLLKDGKIYAADENLNRLADDMYLPIIKIRREEKDLGTLDYYTGNSEEPVIKIFHNGSFVKAVSVEEFDIQAVCLYHALMSSDKGTKSIEDIGNLKSFLEDIFVKKVKAGNKEKADIVLEIFDVYTGFKSLEGFSIKSQMGSASTLFNASKSTNFSYKLQGVTDEIMYQVNTIDTHNKFKDRMKLLRDNNVTFEFCGMRSQVFRNNLILIDSLLPTIFAEALKYYYVEGIDTCTAIVEKLCERNPLGYEVNWIYQYKIQRFLAASALGMVAATPWNGIDEASGGYIVVKSDGDIVAIYLRNRNVFEKYLLNTTKFDKPDSKPKRCDYGYVYKNEHGEYFMDLNLQIRFQA